MIDRLKAMKEQVKEMGPPTLQGVKTRMWGTRKRRIITLTCMTFFLAIFSYLLARVVDALNEVLAG